MAIIKRKVGLLDFFKPLFRLVAGLKPVVVFTALLLTGSVVVYVIEHPGNKGFISWFDSLWWTLVTVTTVGYGDRYPLTIGGRLVAVMIMFLGVCVLGTVTGRIASLLLERQMKEEKGLLSYEKLKGHFVICGWKREMNMFILEMLESNPALEAQQIILINKASPEEISQLRSDERLRDIRYVHGDFIEERDLLRAGVKQAGRVLVVADHYTEGDLQQIDSKTVMAVMSIKNINKKAYVCAELLDNKYEKYLRLSHCDEILLSRQFSRAMLASAAQGAGISHVIHALLGGKSGGVAMATIDLPESLIGHTFDELRQHLTCVKRMILIGLLENTGNLITRKSEALRETQKNPDIEKIITDLRSIKDLEANVPVINPPPDYRIKKYSRGIVIGGSTIPEAVPA